MKRHAIDNGLGMILTVLLSAMVGCGPAMVGEVDEDGSELQARGGEVELPEGQDESFIEGVVLGKDKQVSMAGATSCQGSDADGRCNPDGKTGCRGGLLFACAMGQKCTAQKYSDRDGSFAGCGWEDSGQATQAQSNYCSPEVGGYCKSKRTGVRCDNSHQKTFYCAGDGNTCETRQCGRMTLTGCARNHPCEGIRGTFSACNWGSQKSCWWNGFHGYQKCEGGDWSWMCYTDGSNSSSGGTGGGCSGGQTRTCFWNGYQGHQTCEGGSWSWLCHTNGSNNGNHECNPGQNRTCHWNGYQGHQTCENGQWSYLCHTNTNDGHENYGAGCYPGQTRTCFWNGHNGHQTCEGGNWSWLCHTQNANEPNHNEPNQYNPPEPGNGGWQGNGGCQPGQTRGCSWQGHPGYQKCQGGGWSYLCYTYI